MRRRLALGDGLIVSLLALLPAIALSPFWLETRLLGPGDGAALHFPLREAVWEAYRRFEPPSWNPGIFFGTPLLAAYRPGAFFPVMPILALFDGFDAFQVLVLVSLGAAAALTFLCLKRLGAHNVGAYVAALSFALGPYLVGHLSDTATVVAAPTLPLLLLAAEAHMNRRSRGRAAGLAVVIALLFLAGSPEALGAGLALLVVSLIFRHAGGGKDAPSRWLTAVALVAGLCLAAPQVLPTLYTAPPQGWKAAGLANLPGEQLPGLAGLVVRYVSHTPAPALAVAAAPLVFTQPAFRLFAAVLALSLLLQWGRGPLSAPGALPLLFDFTLAVLGGLSMSALWRTRRLPLGRRLRTYCLVAAMASAAALSVAATVVGPLPQVLSGAVGVLAVAFILWFMLAENDDPVLAGMFLLPLTASFLLQPLGRQIASLAPTRAELMAGTTVRRAVDGAMARRRSEPTLALVEHWPRNEAIDLAYANFGSLAGRRNINGYDPMVPARIREAFEGMGRGGGLRPDFFRTDPTRLAFLGVRWVEMPASMLRPRRPWEQQWMVDVGPAPREFPLPFSAATGIDVVATLTGESTLPPETPVAWIDARLASGRDLRLPLLAGAPQGRLALPGRYHVVGVRITGARPDTALTLSALAVFDEITKARTPVSTAAVLVSDSARFRLALTTPVVWLYEVRHSQGPRVVPTLRRLDSDTAVLDTLRSLTAAGVDVAGEALAVGAEVPAADPPAAAPSRAALIRSAGSRVELYAQGPGFLVIPQSYEAGWRAHVNDAGAPLLRVNHFQTALSLGPGMHRVVLRYRPRGLAAGLVLAVVAASGLAAWIRLGVSRTRPTEATMVG